MKMSGKTIFRRPPRLTEWLIKRLYPDGGAYSTLGDLAEEFQAQAEEKGPFRARLWYRLQLLQSFPYLLRDVLFWRMSMFRNYLKVALRLMRKHEVYTFINITGLAVSMACSLIIVFWVRDETSFDKFNKNLKEIYRVTCIGKSFNGFGSPGALRAGRRR